MENQRKINTRKGLTWANWIAIGGLAIAIASFIYKKKTDFHTINITLLDAETNRKAVLEEHVQLTVSFNETTEHLPIEESSARYAFHPGMIEKQVKVGIKNCNGCSVLDSSIVLSLQDIEVRLKMPAAKVKAESKPAYCPKVRVLVTAGKDDAQNVASFNHTSRPYVHCISPPLHDSHCIGKKTCLLFSLQQM